MATTLRPSGAGSAQKTTSGRPWLLPPPHRAGTFWNPYENEAWHAALALYRSRPDKEWSLVDCSSILICQEQGITRVLTADRHFAQAGLEVLL